MNREQQRVQEQEVSQRGDKDAEEIRDDREQLDEREESSLVTVSMCMRQIFSQHPDFQPPEHLPPEQKEALELLYEAKVGEHTEIGDGHISGLERMKQLNLALATLRPVLSMALGDQTREEIDAYEQLAEKVTELRGELKDVINKEAVPRVDTRDEDEESDSDDDDDDDGDGDDPDDDG